MARTVGIGRQDFEKIRVNHNFYVDKTDFQEVFAALEEYGLTDRKQQVKDWYDGFTFGSTRVLA